MVSFHDFINKAFVFFRINKETNKKKDSFFNHVTWLRSLSTKKLFPTIIFTADTDMVTNGWVCLSNINKVELAITQLTPEEFENVSCGSLVEARVNNALNTMDFRYVCFMKSLETGLCFTDIYDLQGVAKVEKTVTKNEFENEGGVFHILPIK